MRDYAARNNIGSFAALKRAPQIPSLSNAPKSRIAAFLKIMEGLTKHSSGKVTPLAEKVFVESGLEGVLKAQGAEGKNAIENINELISATAQYDEQAEESSLIDYLQQISLYSDADTYDPACGRVALMTLHTAKGLEFDNVFIVGVEEGLLPHERSAEDGDETEEERRLFFVGITRTKTNLYISCARYRTIRGQFLRTIPSQFLFELGLDFTESVGTQPLLAESHADSYAVNAERYTLSADQFRPGQLVAHIKFGLGTVKEFTDMGENSIVVVEFNTGQTKSLKVKYARLLKM